MTTRTTIDRVTYYNLNIELINELLSDIYTSQKVVNTKATKDDFPKCPKGNYVIPQKGNSISNIIYNNNLLPETTTDIKEKKYKKRKFEQFSKANARRARKLC